MYCGSPGDCARTPPKPCLLACLPAACRALPGSQELQVDVTWQDKTPTRLPEAFWLRWKPQQEAGEQQLGQAACTGQPWVAGLWPRCLGVHLLILPRMEADCLPVYLPTCLPTTLQSTPAAGCFTSWGSPYPRWKLW